LYDNNGKAIFSTTKSASNEESARLNLTGEIHVSGVSGEWDDTTYEYKYSNQLFPYQLTYYELKKIEYYNTPSLPSSPQDVYFTTTDFDHMMYGAVYFFTESGVRKGKVGNNYYLVTQKTETIYAVSGQGSDYYSNESVSSKKRYCEEPNHRIKSIYIYEINNSYYGTKQTSGDSE
jgi:hypothetical protein